MGIFDLFSTKAAPIARPIIDDIANAIRWRVGAWGGTVVPTQAGYEAETALHHTIIYRCVDKLALAVQGVDWYVQKIDGRDPQARKYTYGAEAAVAALLNNPNDLLGPAQLKYWLAMNMALYGNVFLKIGIDRTKKTPNGIYPLLTSKTTQMQDTRSGEITGYRLWTQDGYKVINTRRRAEAIGKIADGYAGHIFKPALDYVNKTHSPLQSLGLAPVIATSLMERAWEAARGTPNLKHVVTADRDMTVAQQDEFSREINDRRVGEESAGNVLFISGSNAKFTTIDTGLKDIHTKIPLDDMTRQIAAVFGVPIPLLGLAAADGAKFAGNYAEARLSFIEDTVIPGYLALIEDGLTRMICPDGYEIKFDLDSIECLRERRFSVAKDLAVLPFLTPNEKRAAIGYGPIEGGDELSTAPAPTISAPQPGVTATPPAGEPADDDAE